MLIICPDCEASYEVQAKELGSGRKVRCAECGATWRASGEPAAAQRTPDPVFNLPIEDILGISDTAAAAEAEDIAPVERPARKRTTTPRAMPKPRLAASLAAAGLGVLAALAIWRDTMVSLVPDLAGLYAAAGMPVNLRGLAFRDVDTVETVDNGIPQLVVKGTIANLTRSDVAVPRLRLAVRGGSGREIYVWTAMPGKNVLKGGEDLAFLAQLASPPAEGREVAVRFLGEREAARRSVQ